MEWGEESSVVGLGVGCECTGVYSTSRAICFKVVSRDRAFMNCVPLE